MSHDLKAGAVSTLAAQDRPSFPVEQEYSLEVPFGYAPPPPATQPRIAIILHVFHADLLSEIAAYLGNIEFPADLFVSTTSEAKRDAVVRCFTGWPKGTVEVRVTPNRGRDIAPKLVGFAEVHGRYDYVLHLHTKVSAHDPALEGWRGYLLETLLGSPETVRSIFEAFSRQPRLGMLAPQHVERLRPWIGWGSNLALASELARRMGLALTPEMPLDFPSGSMFWARSAALRPLLDLGLRFEDFPDEVGQTDATLAHGIERLYFLTCEHAGFDWAKIAARGLLHDRRAVLAVRGPAALDRFLSAHRVRLTDPSHERRCTEERVAAAMPSDRPKRPIHVLWRRALGYDLPAPSGRQIVVALLGEEGKAAWARTAASARLALRRLPSGSSGQLLVTDELMAPPVGNDAARCNRVLHAGFDRGADTVVLVTAPGVLHPASIEAILRMAEATGGNSLLEASRFPQAQAKPVSDTDFSTSWAGSPCIAVPHAVFSTLGGFDERLAGRFAEMDLSWHARASGFQVRQCPAALFLCAAGNPAAEADPAMLAIGLLLARKWGNADAEAGFAALLQATGQVLSWPPIDPVPADWRVLADFAGEPALALSGAGPACLREV